MKCYRNWKGSNMAIINGYTFTDVMNAIRQDASPQYQDRIPELNDANFREFASGVSIPVFFNEWHNALINRIGLTILKNRAWENPLAFLKKGELGLGEVVQEIYVGLIDAHKWESFTTETDAGKLYKTEKPDVSSAYHVVNRMDVYEVSYNRAQIEKAFVSPNALEQFVIGIIERLYTSDMLDEYLYMKELIKVYDERGLFNYQTISEDGTFEELITKVRAMSNKFTFMNDSFTGLGVMQHTPKDEQVILISADLDAAIDVTVLASAFNMDKAEFLARRIVLDDLGVEDGVLALVSKDWFMVYDKLREMRMLPNEQTLELKYFYHVHQVISTSLLENAVLFTHKTYEKPVEIEIDELVEDKLTATKGQWITLTPTVLNEGGTVDDTNQAVVYEIDVTAKPGTKMEGNRLYVDLLQEENFFVKVSALHNKDIFLEFEVEIA